jgi:hypothetical protein
MRELESENRELREANEILKKASIFFAREARPSPPQIAVFIDELRADDHGVKPACKVLREQGVQVAPADLPVLEIQSTRSPDRHGRYLDAGVYWSVPPSAT